MQTEFCQTKRQSSEGRTEMSNVDGRGHSDWTEGKYGIVGVRLTHRQ